MSTRSCLQMSTVTDAFAVGPSTPRPRDPLSVGFAPWPGSQSAERRPGLPDMLKRLLRAPSRARKSSARRPSPSREARTSTSAPAAEKSLAPPLLRLSPISTPRPSYAVASTAPSTSSKCREARIGPSLAHNNILGGAPLLTSAEPRASVRFRAPPTGTRGREGKGKKRKGKRVIYRYLPPPQC